MGLDIFIFRKKEEKLRNFRKYNFLIPFFENYGLNVEEQTPLDITKEMASDLITRCNLVLYDKTLAKQELPTCSGFFFGNTDYNEDYFEAIKDVRDFFNDEILKMFEDLDSDETITLQIWY